MRAVILKIEKKPSKYGSFFYYVFFRGDDGKSYYSCIYKKMRNFIRWNRVLEVGTILSNLKVKKGNLIDADSKFIVEDE